MQFTLNAFDLQAKKSKFKVVVVEGSSRNIFFRDAFSEAEIREQYPNAKEIKKLASQ